MPKNPTRKGFFFGGSHYPLAKISFADERSVGKAKHLDQWHSFHLMGTYISGLFSPPNPPTPKESIN